MDENVEGVLSELRRRESAKWRTFAGDVLPLPVAEMDFALAEPVAEALHAAIRRSDTGYAAPSSRLPEALGEFTARRWQWPVDPGRVRTAPDVGVAVVETLRVLVRPGDRVAISTPVYPPFFEWVREVGAGVAEIPLGHDSAGWRLDLDGLEAAFASGVRAYILCSPHNPVGLVHPRPDLVALARLADAYGVTVLADEIHAPLSHPGVGFTPFLSVSEEARRWGVSYLSASKAWNLAGLKCATVVAAHPETARVLDALPEAMQYRTGHLGVLASIAAYEAAEDWLDETLERLVLNRDLLGSLLTEHLPGVGYEPPAASYLAWLDFTPMGWGDDPARSILRDARIGLTPGLGFGPPGAGRARLNFACAPEVLREAVVRIAGLAAG